MRRYRGRHHHPFVWLAQLGSCQAVIDLTAVRRHSVGVFIFIFNCFLSIKFSFRLQLVLILHYSFMGCCPMIFCISKQEIVKQANMGSTTPIALYAIQGANICATEHDRCSQRCSFHRYYAPQAMDNSCLSCDAGKTAASKGAINCDACAAGYYAPNKALLCFTALFVHKPFHLFNREAWNKSILNYVNTRKRSIYLTAF